MSIFKKKDKSLFVIAGPCSAETPEQLENTSKEILNNSSIDMLRTGIWKPRTKPNSFEGIGKEGLAWLNQIQKDYKIPVCCEVANAEQVELCLSHNIDALWLGARTTVNPFYVQEIAESLKGVDIPVMIKNPIHPDVNLWQGAVERFLTLGMKDIAVVHRGFYSYKKGKFRNEPLWEILIELKRRMSDIPLICDPSHIAGDSNLIEEVVFSSLKYGIDGLMIETHINPKEAWSDAKQQLTPIELSHLLEKLPEENKAIVEDLPSKINELRGFVDEIDSQIIEAIFQRMDLIKDIISIKKDLKTPIYQQGRWNEVRDNVASLAQEKNLSEKLILEIFEKIHAEGIARS